MSCQLPARKELVILDDEDEVASTVPSTASRRSSPAPRLTQSQENHEISPSISSGRPPQFAPRQSKANDGESLPQTRGTAYFATPSWQFPEYQRSPALKSPVPSSRALQCSNAAFGIAVLPIPSSPPGQHSTLLTSQTYGSRAASDTPSSETHTSKSMPRSTPIETIEGDDEEDDYMDEDELSAWMSQQHEEETRRTSSETKAVIRRRSSVIVPRNPPITYPLKTIDKYVYDGIQLTPNCFVELRDEDFLRVVHIVKDTLTSEVSLRGFIFRRTREMNGLLNRLLNEVCWIIHVDDDDPREPLIQGVETRAVSEVVRRRAIRLTNRPFPDLSFRDDNKDTEQNVINHGVLVCRYKYLCVYPNAKARMAYAWCEKGLLRLRADECDRRANNNIKDSELRHAWRGPSSAGGAKEGWLLGEKEFSRQEAVSNRGVSSWQSLKAAGGPNFPPGNIMERRGVGSILNETDLSRKVDTSATSSSRYKTSRSSLLRNLEPAPNVGGDEVIPSPSCPVQRICEYEPRPSSSPWFDVSTSPSKVHDGDDATHMFDLPGSLERSEIESLPISRTSPQVVEIDAKVKTSSGSGTFKKHYEGRITSTFIPNPLAKMKRSADECPNTYMRPAKKPYGNLSRRPSIECSWGENSTSNSDRFLTHSDSEDSVEDIPAPLKPRNDEPNKIGLLTPRSSGCLLPICADQRKSIPGVGGHHLLNADHDEVIDLTTPRANTTPRLHAGFTQPSFHRTSESSEPPFFKASVSLPKVFRHTTQAQEMGSSLSRCAILAQTTKRPRSPESNNEPSRKAVKLSRGSIAKCKSPLRATPVSDSLVQTQVINKSSSRLKQRRYTFGDCFCGAGGMSRGAVNAGLRIDWGFDFNLAACQSYEMNFFGTKVYNVAADQFLNAEGDHKVDICHLSPPCQFFSDAHTVQGKDDDMNTASLFAIFNLLRKTKPRVATLEQTSGLIRRHPIFFNAVINMFTSNGFSVRWRVMNCADFGLPQRRMRLFIIASCPGEPLPPFPTPTHSTNPTKTGLKPWTTINQAIASIPSSWPNHDPHSVKQRDIPPQPGDKIATCITTNGGQNNVHPSGKRDYTHREFACLQSFPLGHKFGSRGVKKQIGNGVPPVVATVLLEEVKSSLLRADGLL